MSQTVPLTTFLRPSLFPEEALGQRQANRYLIFRHAFLSCLLFIVGVSFYDCYLVAINRECILFDERNPICEILIRRDPNNLSWFMAGKLLGNLGVVGTLLLLHWIGYRHSLVVAQGVAIFQKALLIFLTFSDSKTGLLHFDDLLSHDPAKAAKAWNSAIMHAAACLGIVGIVVFSVIKWKSIRNPPCSEPAPA